MHRRSHLAGLAALAATTSLAAALAGAPAHAGSTAPADQTPGARFTAPVYQQSMGKPGHAGVYAWGAATAADGTILVGDYWNYTVRRYSTDGRLLQSISSKGTGFGQNMAPHGVAVSPVDGSIYLVDMNAPWEIDRFDAAGIPIGTIKTFVPGATVPYPYVTRVAVNSKGELVAVTSHNVGTSTGEFQHRVVVYSPEGQYLRHFGENGTADGKLGLTRGIDVGPDDEIYLADSAKHKVQVFSSDGRFLRSFGAGRFRGDMRGVRVDKARGVVYVVDAAGSQIEKFRLDGTWLTAWGSEGTGPGQFRDGGRELAIGANGDVYAPDFGGNRVHVFSPTGQHRWTFPSPAPQPADDGFNQAQDVSVSPDGRTVWTADTYNHRVQRWTPDGMVRRVLGFRGSTDPYALNYPRGVEVDRRTGDVLVLNSRQGNVKRYSAEGRHKATFGSWGRESGQLNLPRGLDTDAAGRIYVADSNNRRVQVFTAAGQPLREMPCGGPPVSGVGPQLLMGCTGVTVDGAGVVYAAAVTEHAVHRWAADGTPLPSIGTLGSRPGQLRAPYDVAVHDGRLYVSESGNNRVSVFTLDGTYLGRFGSRGDGPGQLRTPRGLDVDDAGRLYVMDSQNERVQVWQLR